MSHGGRSPLGPQLDRADLFGVDENNKPIMLPDRHQIGYGVMPVKPTPPHALSFPDANERLDAVRDAEHAWSKLTEQEQAVITLQDTPVGRSKERKLTILAGDLKKYFGKGYTFLRELPEETRADGTVVQYVVVEGRESQHMTQEQIADKLGITVDQVKKRILSARRKLREATKEGR